MTILGARRNEKGEPHYEFTKAISYLRQGFGDEPLTKRNLETLLVYYIGNRKLRKYRKLYAAIYLRIEHHDQFRLPTDITPTTQKELGFEECL